MKYCLTAAFAALMIASASAQVNIDMDDGSLSALATSLAQQSGARVLIAPGAVGKVNLHLQGVSVETAVKTTAASLGLKWRVLWLKPNTAPRITSRTAADLAVALDGLSTVPMAMDNGKRIVSLGTAPTGAPAKDGLIPVYLLLPRDAPKTALTAPAPVTAPNPVAEPPAMARSNDPEVLRVQTSFASLSPEQQRTFMNNVRSYWRRSGTGSGDATGANNNIRRNRNRQNNGNRG